MNPKIAVPLCSTVLTAIVLLALQPFWTLPLWPVFVAWACFFHVGGAEDPRGAAASLLACTLFGLVMAWLTALALQLLPADAPVPAALSGPLLIAASVGVIAAASAWKPLALTPVCIYGYAAVWAFLDVPGRFTIANLTSLSAANPLPVLAAGILVGCLCGWLNALCVAALTRRRPIPA